jgi:hypothetical protein
MATKTAGTNATTSLTALPFLPGLGSGMAAADIATIEQAIVGDNRAGPDRRPLRQLRHPLPPRRSAASSPQAGRLSWSTTGAGR